MTGHVSLKDKRTWIGVHQWPKTARAEPCFAGFGIDELAGTCKALDATWLRWGNSTWREHSNYPIRGEAILTILTSENQVWNAD